MNSSAPQPLRGQLLAVVLMLLPTIGLAIGIVHNAAPPLADPQIQALPDEEVDSIPSEFSNEDSGRE